MFGRQARQFVRVYKHLSDVAARGTMQDRAFEGMDDTAQVLQTVRPVERETLLQKSLTQAALLPKHLTKLAVRADFCIVVAVEPSVILVLSGGIDGQSRLGVQAGLLERADLIVAGPGAVMGLKQKAVIG